MRRRRATLQEKVFIIKSYYSYHESGPFVQEEFNKMYKVQTTDAIQKIIKQLVSRFETTGSVASDVFFENGTIIKQHEEESVKIEEQIEYPLIVQDEHGAEVQIYYADERAEPVAEEEVKGEEVSFEMASLPGSDQEQEEDSEEDLIETDEEVEEEELEDDEPPVVVPRRGRKKKLECDYTYGEYHCPVCGKTFTKKESFDRHKDIHKPLHKWIPCTICQRPCRTNSQRIRHEYIHLSLWECEKSECHICGKTCKGPVDLQFHLKRHERARPLSHICDICGRASNSAHALKIHTRIHTGERPHACKFCDKTYSTKGGLEIHIRTHTGETPFKCETCGKGFKDRSTMKVHYRQHTGETPYVCQICGHKCKQAQNLRSHIRHMHKPEALEYN